MFSYVSVQQPSSFIFVLPIMFWSIDVLLSIALFAFPTNTLRKLHINMREQKTYNTLISQYFHFFGSCAFNCVLNARMGAYLSPSSRRPAFPYWGPFRPAAHRGRCGQMCLSKTNARILFEEKGRRDSQRHHKLRPKCHLTHSPPCLADQWTEMDRLQLKCLCLLIGLGSFGSGLIDKSQNKRFTRAQRTFHRRERFRNTNEGERHREARSSSPLSKLSPHCLQDVTELGCHLRR